MKKLKGFTLSEILIAMLVLGIVIAASVPVILQMSPNKNAIMMKKAYYTTETIIESLINDTAYYPNDEDGFANTDPVDIVGTSITTGSDKLQCLFASKLNIKEDLASVCNGTIDTVTTMDGMTWNLAGLPNSGANGTLNIDVDGIENGVSSYFDATCGTGDWSTGCTPSGYTLKKADRIEITISSDGRLSINGQARLVEILAGRAKLIGGDED